MDIQVTKIKKKYYKAEIILSGSPPVGFGKTSEMAIASLFFSMLTLQRAGKVDWLKHISLESLKVNGFDWEMP